MDLNFNSNYIARGPGYSNQELMGQFIAPDDRTQQLRFNNTMTDIINSDTKHRVHNIPHGSSISYLTDAKTLDPIPLAGYYNVMPGQQDIHDNYPTLDQQKEAFNFRERFNKKITISGDIVIFAIVIVVLVCVYFIVNIYISQKKIEFMLNFIHSEKHDRKPQ